MTISPEVLAATKTPAPNTIIVRFYGLETLNDEKINHLIIAVTKFFGQKVGVYRQSITVWAELPSLTSSARFLAQLEQLFQFVRLNIGQIMFAIEYIYSEV